MQPDRFAMPSALYQPPQEIEQVKLTDIGEFVLWTVLAALGFLACWAVAIMAESLMSP